MVLMILNHYEWLVNCSHYNYQGCSSFKKREINVLAKPKPQRKQRLAVVGIRVGHSYHALLVQDSIGYGLFRTHPGSQIPGELSPSGIHIFADHGLRPASSALSSTVLSRLNPRPISRASHLH